VALGEGTYVGWILFLPSGLALAVGANDGRQAAVYLTFVDHGRGLAGLDKRLPRSARLFTTDELETLLSP